MSNHFGIVNPDEYSNSFSPLRILRSINPIFIQYVTTSETQRASLEDLQLVHSNDYIANLGKTRKTLYIKTLFDLTLLYL